MECQVILLCVPVLMWLENEVVISSGAVCSCFQNEVGILIYNTLSSFCQSKQNRLILLRLFNLVAPLVSSRLVCGVIVPRNMSTETDHRSPTLR